MQRLEGQIQIHVKGAGAVLPKVVAVAEQGGFRIADLSVAEPTLQTVFTSLTGKELRQ